ncbi:unnamed protein product [Angiostrongylus costaricensis]|uniref:HYPK_UBA domain-containing protein n=1 Tax=Angiostrongylus costaricensis TaxID=334426 RepID=A0A0R3PH58_ANGCS|nr:unnamed protein product [Angiostrongylus costaricensis]
MADKDDGLPDEDVKQNDKHNWGAADLEKVNVVEEEKDDLRMSSDALGKIIANPQQPRQKIVNIKKDDLEMIMNELELPKDLFISERNTVVYHIMCGVMADSFSLE